MWDRIIINILIILSGFLVKSLEIFPKEAGNILSRFVLYITLPATIFSVFTKSTVDPNFIILPISAISIGTIVFILSYLLLKKIYIEEKTKWSLLISMCGYNIGLFAYPFIQTLYGDQGVLMMAMFDIGNSLIVFGLAYAVSLIAFNNRINYKEIIKKVITFFPLDIYLISILFNLLKIKLPFIINELISQLAIPNNTLALFTLGYFLDFNLNPQELKAILLGLLLRIIPGILVSVILSPLSNYLIAKIISIGTLLPVPLVAIVYSNERSLNPKFASVFVTLTIITGVIAVTLL